MRRLKATSSKYAKRPHSGEAIAGFQHAADIGARNVWQLSQRKMRESSMASNMIRQFDSLQTSEEQNINRRMSMRINPEHSKSSPAPLIFFSNAGTLLPTRIVALNVVSTIFGDGDIFQGRTASNLSFNGMYIFPV
jgi:hypothetical protein